MGVDDVAAGLAHLHALRVADEAAEVDGVEGHLAGVLDAEHDHAGDPEEEDVVAGLHDAAGVEGAEVVGLVGPAQGGMRPEAGAEPGVEDVRVLREVRTAALGADVGVFVLDDGFAAGVAVPDGDAMGPTRAVG